MAHKIHQFKVTPMCKLREEQKRIVSRMAQFSHTCQLLAALFSILRQVFVFPRFQSVDLCVPALFIHWFIYFPALAWQWLQVFPPSFVTLFMATLNFSYYFLKVRNLFFLYTVGERKRAIAKVAVKRGSGNVTVNDMSFTKYFGRMEDRYGMNL